MHSRQLRELLKRCKDQRRVEAAIGNTSNLTHARKQEVKDLFARYLGGELTDTEFDHELCILLGIPRPIVVFAN